MNGMGGAQEGQEGHQAVSEERDAPAWRGVLLRVTLYFIGEFPPLSLLFTSTIQTHNGSSCHL
jgi:hypothetical protein